MSRVGVGRERETVVARATDLPRLAKPARHTRYAHDCRGRHRGRECATPRSMPPPLAGLRALDLTDPLGYLCGRLLVDLGVDVIKVEPPGGDPGRALS